MIFTTSGCDNKLGWSILVSGATWTNSAHSSKPFSEILLFELFKSSVTYCQQVMYPELNISPAVQASEMQPAEGAAPQLTSASYS